MAIAARFREHRFGFRRNVYEVLERMAARARWVTYTAIHLRDDTARADGNDCRDDRNARMQDGSSLYYF